MQSECTRTVGQGEVYITSSTWFRREFFEKKRNLCKALKNVASIRDPLQNKIAHEMEIEQSPLSLSEGICCQYSSFVQGAKKSKETSNCAEGFLQNFTITAYATWKDHCISYPVSYQLLPIWRNLGPSSSRTSLFS